MDTPAVLLQIVEGTVSEIVSDTYVTRLTLDDETVWFRTSRAGRPPIAVGDAVAVVAGSIDPGSALIAIQIRRLRDARSFRPHKHTSIALRLAASALFSAHAAVGGRGLSIAAAAVGPLASFGRGYLQAQVDIVERHMALVANRAQPAAANDAVAASSPSPGVAIGMQGAAPTTEAPWWHSELLEHTHDAIMIWEMEGAGILYWNHAAEQLTDTVVKRLAARLRTTCCEQSHESPSKTSSRCLPAMECGSESCAIRPATAGSWRSKLDFHSCRSEAGSGWSSRSIGTSPTAATPKLPEPRGKQVSRACTASARQGGR